LVCFISLAVVAQDAGTPVVIVKFSWNKERIRPLASVASLASQDELIQQSRREQQLTIARNTGDRGTTTKLETQISNDKEAKAKAKAQQTELPRDGYRYKVTLRNESAMTIKSIDWDYVFVDPITEQELARHQFTSDETIKSGKSKELSVLYLTPPVKTVDARSLGKKDPAPFIEQVIVARIQFSDGSVWQHP
jgi:hypothetical protein